MDKTHEVKSEKYDEVEKALYVITYCGERHAFPPIEDGTGMARPNICQECADAKAKDDSD